MASAQSSPHMKGGSGNDVASSKMHQSAANVFHTPPHQQSQHVQQPFYNPHGSASAETMQFQAGHHHGYSHHPHNPHVAYGPHNQHQIPNDFDGSGSYYDPKVQGANGGGASIYYDQMNFQQQQQQSGDFNHHPQQQQQHHHHMSHINSATASALGIHMEGTGPPPPSATHHNQIQQQFYNNRHHHQHGKRILRLGVLFKLTTSLLYLGYR